MEKHAIIDALRKNQSEFHPVVPFDPSKDTMIPFDFSNENTELDGGILTDTRRFTEYVNEKISSAKARYGIGGYGEHRTVYNASKVFDGKEPGSEPRRFHLGIDIWGKPYTKVMAPLHGIVHSFAFNNNFGDYGATIILSHVLDGEHFYTLYGHLSLNSIKNMQEGDTILKGDVFAEFGIPMENGHWPPHLHFQLIADLEDWKGDYPGVCRYSERTKYLENCPDPELILQLSQYFHPKNARV